MDLETAISTRAGCISDPDGNPCENGGTCTDVPALDTFVCTCPNGFTGEICQYPGKRLFHTTN